MEFVIDRSKWRCGGDEENKVGIGQTSLLNPSGYMCCLGQTCRQIGVKAKDIKDVAEPYGIPGHYFEDKHPKTFFEPCEDFLMIDGEVVEGGLINTKLSESAMWINDDEEIGQEEREKKLTELFTQYGHTIKFINDPYFPKRKS